MESYSKKLRLGLAQLVIKSGDEKLNHCVKIECRQVVFFAYALTHIIFQTSNILLIGMNKGPSFNIQAAMVMDE